MMALHVGLRRATPLAAIVGYSGMLVLPEPPGARRGRGLGQIEAAGAARSWQRGRTDPGAGLFHATQTLAALEIPAEWHISHGVGHGIDAEGLRHGGEFLARQFRLPR